MFFEFIWSILNNWQVIIFSFGIIYLFYRINKNQATKEINLINNQMKEKIDELNKQMKKKTDELNKQMKDKADELKKEAEDLKNKQIQYEKELKVQKELIRHSNVQTFLLNELIDNNTRNSDYKNDLLNKQYYFLLSCYRILFFRKLANTILETLFEGENQSSYYKTGFNFIDESKPKNLQLEFKLIIAKCDIKNVPMNEVNLLIDFYMFIKDKCSDVIHISDKNALFNLDLIIQILGEKEEITKNKNNDYILSSFQVINLLFNKSDNFDKENTLLKYKINEEENKLEKNTDNTYSEIIDKNKEKKEEFTKIKNFLENIIETKEKEDKQIILVPNFNFSEPIKNGNNNQINNGSANGSNTSIFNGSITEKDDIYLTIYKLLNSDEIELITSKIKSEIELASKIELCFEKNNALIEQLRTEISKNIYDIDYLFKQWKNSFNYGYKTDDIFKKIIKFSPNITLDKIKENTTKLIGNKVMKIYKEDASKFISMIDSVLEKNSVENYQKSWRKEKP